MRAFKSFLRSFFASLLAFVVLILLVVAIVAAKTSQKPTIKDHTYLVVDIHGEILPYYPPDGIVAEIMGGAPETLHRILTNLEKAAVDERIEGVIVRLSAMNTLGGGSTQEIRGAIKNIREAGKTVYAYSDDIDRSTLVLASACDSIFMPPTGYIIFTGFGGTTQYVKGMLEKLGIEPNIHKIKDYKSAAELVLRENMSPEAREMYNWLVDDIWEMLIGAFSKERGIPEEKLIGLMEHALFTAEEAAEAGLIDGTRYWHELTDGLKQEDDKKLRTVTQAEYAKIDRAKVGLKGKKKIAVVHAHGLIGGRKSQVNPFLGTMMGHESVRSELRNVRMDEDIAAVIFRISSGGGEALATDLIGHEVAIVAAEKPVVTSMIDVAASGGYGIAYRATKIVADPATITGSIGSISGKFNMSEFFGKLGITFDHLTKGPNGLFWSPHTNFTEEQRKRHADNHWDGFNIWLEDVAKCRGIPLEDMDKLAQGRVWTGRQAKANGLIDEVGGLDRAIELAKELADIPADEEVTLVHYPKKKGLLASLTGGGSAGAACRWVIYRFIRDDVASTVHMLANGAVLPETWYTD